MKTLREFCSYTKKVSTLICVHFYLGGCFQANSISGNRMDASVQDSGVVTREVIGIDFLVSDTQAFDQGSGTLDGALADQDNSNADLGDLNGREGGSPTRDGGLSGMDVRLPSDAFTSATPTIVAGCDIDCTIRRTGDVYCWGYGRSLNTIGTPNERGRPRRVAELHHIVQLATSCTKACAVAHDRSVWCWGENFSDSLRTGSSDILVTSPRRRLDVSGVVQAALMSSAFMARYGDGSIYGLNNPTVLRFTPPAPAIDLQADSLGYCVALSGGQLFCDEGDFRRVPQAVATLSDVVSTAVGPLHVCALRRNGTVWCWGHNEVGQTGLSPQASELCEGERRNHPLFGYIYTWYYCVRQPRQVEGLTDVVEVSAGRENTCARRRDGTVWCWGANYFPLMPDSGQGIIGDGMPNTELCPSAPWTPQDQTPGPRPCRRQPSRVAGLTGVTSISVGSYYACAIRAPEEVWCWGARDFAGLGPTTTPVQISMPDTARDE